MEVWRSVHPEVTLIALTTHETEQMRVELKSMLYARYDAYALGRLLAFLDRLSVPSV